MGDEALKTLFYPFEAGLLAVPGKGERVLFLGAEPGFRLPSGFEAAIVAAQGFRPAFLALRSAGVETVPSAPDGVFDQALVVGGRHRGENERRLAAALRRTKPGGLVLMAGSKADGIASLRKRLSLRLDIDGHVPKFHGVAFWLRSSPEANAAASGLEAEDHPGTADGRFWTAPGMFSHGRIDPGSALLASVLPEGLAGSVADFCAGWGYLAAEIGTRCAGVERLDLYEADFASLDAARRNLAAATTPVRFFWHDLLGEPIGERYDAIVMNPPFHRRGREADPDLGAGMIGAAADALKRGGRLFMVANRQLPYEAELGRRFRHLQELARDENFKVMTAER